MKRDSKIVLSIIFGGLFFIIILIFGISALIGGSNSTLNMSPNGDTVAIIPLQGEIAYGSSGIIGGSVISPEMVQDAISIVSTHIFVLAGFNGIFVYTVHLIIF